MDGAFQSGGEEMNNLDLTKWKELDNIWTHSLWCGNYRMKELQECGNRKFHGNFIPEIPYQMMLRYTKEGEKVLDPFAGSGTTGDVAKILNRDCDMYDLNPVRDDIKKADARSFDYNCMYHLVILHPPYADIIKFSNDVDDLSMSYPEPFLTEFRKMVLNISKYLLSGRYLILVCGEIWVKGEEFPLGVYCSDIIRDCGFERRGIIVKDYGQGIKDETQNLKRYRHLKNGTWDFFGDTVFVMRKKGL